MVCARVKDIDGIAYGWKFQREKEHEHEWEKNFFILLWEEETDQWEKENEWDVNVHVFLNLFHFRFILRNIQFLSTKKKCV